MWVVVDWCTTKIIGPFPSWEAAEDWLRGKNIDPDGYYDSEVSINGLLDPSLYNFGNID